MKVLKLKIFQPTAHYRIPFTFARKHTYPIPPYSTVIGLICNVLGIERQDGDFEILKNGLSLAIYGKYEYLNREYIWLRTLSKEEHNRRFGYPENRIIDQMPEHPGGQIPARIDVLENVNLLIYIKHEDEKFLKKMKNAFENPEQRIYPLHLGRAEDLVIFDDVLSQKKGGGKNKTKNSVIFKGIEIVEVNRDKKPVYGGLKNYDFTWLVDPERGEKYLDESLNCENYKEFFKKTQGSYHLITSFYKIIEEIRVFEYVPVKLFEGGSFPLYFGKPFEFIFDEKENIPLFFAKMIYPED